MKNSDGSGKPNTTETAYQMSEAEAKVLLETKVHLEGGGKVDAVDDQSRTRLHRAVSQGYKNLAEFLIEHGANVNAQDEYGLTPLHLAAMNGDKTIFFRLLRSKTADINAQDNRGHTPLDLIRIHGHLDVFADLLCKQGDKE